MGKFALRGSFKCRWSLRFPADHSDEVARIATFFESTLGFAPNSVLTMQRRPEIAKAFTHLNRAVMDNGGRVTSEQKRLIGHLASANAGCRYCEAHTVLAAKRFGASDERLAELWGFRASTLFSDAEKAAFEFALAASSVTHGTTLGAFEAWLLTRGMRTLDVRVRAQSRSALMLANRLEINPAISSVLYPGLPDHPGHDIAKRQMKDGYGGMLSFRVKGGELAAIRVAANVALWKRATSLGGVESLIEHRSSIEGSGSPCPSDLLRLSVGLEDVNDLSIDLERALAIAHGF